MAMAMRCDAMRCNGVVGATFNFPSEASFIPPPLFVLPFSFSSSCRDPPLPLVLRRPPLIQKMDGCERERERERRTNPLSVSPPPPPPPPPLSPRETAETCYCCARATLQFLGSSSTQLSLPPKSFARDGSSWFSVFFPFASTTNRATSGQICPVPSPSPSPSPRSGGVQYPK